jgi:hypothetical protein
MQEQQLHKEKKENACPIHQQIQNSNISHGHKPIAAAPPP